MHLYNPFHRRGERSQVRNRTKVVNAFFDVVLPFVEQLEASDDILVITEKKRSGMVLSSKLGDYYRMCYLARIQYYTRQFGTVERFFRARASVKKFARKHNPDSELLELCKAVRHVISYRRAAESGGKASGKDSAFDANSCAMSSDEPLFITIMNEEVTASTCIGFEVRGEIILEQSKTGEDGKQEETPGGGELS